jgi:radical SAM protein with 4Fe4S-binding SPASM domain
MDPVRYLSDIDIEQNKPVHAVWELTLACNLKCCHCGSRAGRKRRGELSTHEAIQLVGQLAELGVREVTLIGGEAYLRKDWSRIISAIVTSGMMCSLQTGARNMTDARIAEAASAGLGSAGVSIDGLRALHDKLRGVEGLFDTALETLQRFRGHGIATSVTTQITQPAIAQLDELSDLLISAKVKNWQVQLTAPMGRAADNSHLILQPWHLLDLMPLLAKLYRKGAQSGLLLQPGNNIGYFGPYEGLLRGSGAEAVHYQGCFAGRNVIGIEADGTIKGCPSLATDAFAGGNVRDVPLQDIWRQTPQLSFARRLTRADLWGFCATCYYADVCKGGCTWMSHSVLGRAGNNPFCHHRALELAKDNRRESIVKVAPAPGRPFDRAQFEIVLETSDGQSIDAREPAIAPGSARAISATRSPEPRLALCRGCNRHVLADAETCPFCNGPIAALAERFEQKFEAAMRAKIRLQRAIQHLNS